MPTSTSPVIAPTAAPDRLVAPDAGPPPVAAAPVSWGVCEVPGWGTQLDADRILAEMAGLGFTATELGPEDWLGHDPAAVRARLAAHRLAPLGGFVPVETGTGDRGGPIGEGAADAAHRIRAVGGRFLVSCPLGPGGWAAHDDRGARPDRVAEVVDALDDLAAGLGLEHVVHPHWGAAVQEGHELDDLLAATDARLCLDTGHVALGGRDPVALARDHADRIGLVHLKDLDRCRAEALRRGDLDLVEATRGGLFPPLGDGDLPLGEVIHALTRSHRSVPWVLEQDVALDGPPPEDGAGPLRAVARGLAHLERLWGAGR